MRMPLFLSARARSATLALSCFLAAILAATHATNEPRELAAASNHGRTDLDGDGLTDQQERNIGTLADHWDSDWDEYSDLEERARGSDPLDVNSVPADSAFAVGTCASLEGEYVSMVSAVYSAGGNLDEVQLEVGLVYGGRIFRISPRNYTYSRGFVYQGHDAQDRLAVVELAIPEVLVRRIGQVNLFSVVRGAGANAPAPSVSVLPLVDFSGVTVVVEQLFSNLVSSNNERPTGVTYRPLAGDDDIPVTWSGGEICAQRTSVVGTNGVSTVHEIDSAECESMDTYCSSQDCSSGVGTSLQLPDPGALAGG